MHIDGTQTGLEKWYRKGLRQGLKVASITLRDIGRRLRTDIGESIRDMKKEVSDYESLLNESVASSLVP